MRKYIFISIGGILGALTRYLIGSSLNQYSYHLPIHTLIINFTGCLILALVLSIAFEVWELDVDLRIGIATGFLGAYTTFSTLCKETALLMKEGFFFSAITYIALSTILGFVGIYLGSILARQVVSRLVKKDKREYEADAIDPIEGGVE